MRSCSFRPWPAVERIEMFQLTDQPIDPAKLREKFPEDSRGAFVTFEGWVRNRNAGRAVVSLEYEMFGPLAEKEGGRIIEEAKQKHAISAAVCVHRRGHLGIGEIAVWVGVASAHRGAAFDACRYIIDEVKARVPIWKKEHYADGSSGWIEVSDSGKRE